jgi:deoxyribodipyrimidine photo-lyase
MTSPVEPERIHELAGGASRAGRYVLYWMQSSVRSQSNPALEYAIEEANHLDAPLVVGFGLTTDYPEASERHYRFLLEGLHDASAGLAERNIQLVVRLGSPVEVAAELATDACSVVTDRGYLRHHRQWRQELVRRYDGPVVEVEGDVVVPVEAVSDKREYAARTLRPKVHRLLDQYLQEPARQAPDRSSMDLSFEGEDVSDVDPLLDGLSIDRSVPAVPQHFQGGEQRAHETLGTFLDERFSSYSEHRNQPQTDDVSGMSMYLHYGHISPVSVALAARRAKGSGPDLDDFIEELIVRRELAFNYAWFEPDYDRYASLPEWARETLRKHRDDPREHVYTRSELEQGETHDRYWNAAMAEMRETGYLHNYMRMYWGKKILEWTNTPEYGYRTTLVLNNRYLLDGRDPNSYTGVGWVYGLHDRPWTERPIFGTVRYMSAGGLERKADPEAYVAKIEERIGHSL